MLFAARALHDVGGWGDERNPAYIAVNAFTSFHLHTPHAPPPPPPLPPIFQARAGTTPGVDYKDDALEAKILEIRLRRNPESKLEAVEQKLLHIHGLDAGGAPPPPAGVPPASVGAMKRD